MIAADARTQDVSEFLRDLRISTIELRERLAAELSRVELLDILVRCGLPARALHPPL